MGKTNSRPRTYSRSYQELRDLLDGAKEVWLDRFFNLSAKLYKHRVEVKSQPGSADGKSKFYWQVVVMDGDRKVALNRNDRLGYSSDGSFWHIPGPGSFKDPVRNLLTYTLLGQSVLKYTDDPVAYDARCFALTIGAPNEVNVSPQLRRLEGGDLIVVFSPSGRNGSRPEHHRFHIHGIYVRKNADKEKVAGELKEFFIMLLTSEGQKRLLQPFFSGEIQRRAIEAAAENLIREAQQRLRDEDAGETARLAAETRRMQKEIDSLWEKVFLAISDGNGKERRFEFEGQTHEFEPNKNGSRYSAIYRRDGMKFLFVTPIEAYNSGLLQAWADNLRCPVDTH